MKTKKKDNDKLDIIQLLTNLASRYLQSYDELKDTNYAVQLGGQYSSKSTTILGQEYIFIDTRNLVVKIMDIASLMASRLVVGVSKSRPPITMKYPINSILLCDDTAVDITPINDDFVFNDDNVDQYIKNYLNEKFKKEVEEFLTLDTQHFDKQHKKELKVKLNSIKQKLLYLAGNCKTDEERKEISRLTKAIKDKCVNEKKNLKQKAKFEREIIGEL